MSGNCDLTAIRRPDGTYVTSVEPLGFAGAARTLSAGATSSSTALTPTCRRVSIKARTADIRFEIGVGVQTASATSHFISSNERLDFAVPDNAAIGVIRATTTDAVLEVTELV